ncbi:MAG: hypothetical protein A4S09_12825 [Proteobacteria bacterium SG_bin7]|nr:MAG: hypothetical protein A4S09_12825 [Proteobacteria bacterium SG_bin7]
MEQSFQLYLAQHLRDVPARSVQAVLDLVKEGATVPFIARYRKEKTGNLDEVKIRDVLKNYETFAELVKRKDFILKEIESQGNLTEELKKAITATDDLTELDEIYRPFKKKKKTKATIAREAGLEPLADWLWGLAHKTVSDGTAIEVKAKTFLNPAAQIITYEVAIKGAQDILIEKLSNDPELRQKVRDHLNEKGKIVSKKTKKFKPNSKYANYADYSDPVKVLQNAKSSHRYLAIRRGWHEGELTVAIDGDNDYLQKIFTDFACPDIGLTVSSYLIEVAKLALTAHVIPSVVNQIHNRLKELADEHAIKVFSENLRKLLMASPFGSKCVLGVDPGFKSGCKIALIDLHGNYISHTVLHTTGDGAEETAKKLIGDVMKQLKIEAVAVGNGTGGREAEAFFRKILKEIGSETPIVMVNEAGASVYSASEVAREEFPELDVSVRGAISIARRLQDPLAELVKIDPKSIGVGQYQHDVSQTELKNSLHGVVESCVNQVGVNLNTASSALLSYVAGIGPAIAQGIVAYRKTNGSFSERGDLNKVSHFSSKTFEQAAGFLRIPGGSSPLDNTGIHPERYTVVREMAKDLGLTVGQMVTAEGATQLKAKRDKWVELIGEYTFNDIVNELQKPGRDPRPEFKNFSFREDIHDIKDLKKDMVCPGIVTNVTNFGAFVDVGVRHDGLVHISEISHEFVSDPRQKLSPGDFVQVKVLAVDLDKPQVSLTMKLTEKPVRPSPRDQNKERRDERPRPPRRDAPPRGDGKSRPSMTAKSSGKSSGRGPHKPQRPGPQKVVLNNPFAALAEFRDKLKSKN